MKQTLLTICLILFALPIWGQTTFSGGNISGGKIGSTDTEGSWAGKTKAPYEFITIEGQIPLTRKYDLTPTKSDILLTDTRIYEYPHCEDSIKSNKRLYPYDPSSVESLTKKIAVKDINDVIDFSDGDDKGPSDVFGMTINKAHMACLEDGLSGCSSIWVAMNILSKADAFTKNTKAGNSLETYFQTIHRMLKPLLAAYSTASQKLGRHKKDEIFKVWMKEAIFQNTYNPFADKGTRDRDLVREKPVRTYGPKYKKMGRDPAQNHSLQSGLIAMMYGVLWEDEHLYQVGLDSYLITLESVNEDGVLELEAIRGGSGLFYSGATLHTLLQIREIAKNQGHFLDELFIETNRIHDVASFLLDVVENEKLILKYAKANRTNSMCNTYQKQCFHDNKRDTAFGWVTIYLKNFPNHENSKRIIKFYEELVSSQPINDMRKENLNAVIKGNFNHEPFRHNLTYPTKNDEKDSYDFKIFPQDTNWNIGSPRCMFDRRSK
tara:strand:- start:1457 stop:2932 length:1476 start_codon:yes stop_codon:yes gene_type:complete